MNANQPFATSKNKELHSSKIYHDKLLGDDGYDYSKVEDIAGVDYKKAMILTSIFIGLHISPNLIWGIFPLP